MSALTVTDFFCGAGGSSTGIREVPGFDLRYAANHWDLAIELHNANHPDVDHSVADLHLTAPGHFAKTDVLWASPECTKWSQAGGSKQKPAIEEGLFEDPLSDEAANRSRLLMFDVLRFAEHHRYRAMIVENVVDIATQSKYALAWYEWRRQLANLGYRHRVVSLNSMHAQAFGLPAPQSRDRIYIVCWREGENPPDLDAVLRPKAYCARCGIVVEASQSWKQGRTVGRYRQAYLYVHGACGQVVEPFWMPAASAIDWSLPGTRIGDREKPLAEKTLARIAAGIARYWGPFHLEAAGNSYDAADPAHPRHGERDAYYRAWDVRDPLKALHTTNSKALAVPMEGREGKQAGLLDVPLRTQTTRLETALVTEFFGTSVGRPSSEALSTVMAGALHHGLVQANNHENRAHPDVEPLPTATTATGGGMALVTNHLSGSDLARTRSVAEALNTIVASGFHASLVTRMNSGGAEMTTPVFEELRTLTTAGHQALIRPPRPVSEVTAADLAAAREMLPEVLFRMFEPHECAAGQAFPSDYIWDVSGKRTSKRDKVKAIGNAVTPPAARDLGAAVFAALTGESVAA